MSISPQFVVNKLYLAQLLQADRSPVGKGLMGSDLYQMLIILIKIFLVSNFHRKAGFIGCQASGQGINDCEEDWDRVAMSYEMPGLGRSELPTISIHSCHNTSI